MTQYVTYCNALEEYDVGTRATMNSLNFLHLYFEFERQYMGMLNTRMLKLVLDMQDMWLCLANQMWVKVRFQIK